MNKSRLNFQSHLYADLKPCGGCDCKYRKLSKKSMLEVHHGMVHGEEGKEVMELVGAIGLERLLGMTKY